MVADSSGNLYIADTSNNRVQEVAATTHTQFGISMTAGDIYTIAGSASGTSGSSGRRRVATSALLSSPTGVALDSSGNLYIADQANNRVQFVAASGARRLVPGGFPPPAPATSTPLPALAPPGTRATGGRQRLLTSTCLPGSPWTHRATSTSPTSTTTGSSSWLPLRARHLAGGGFPPPPTTFTPSPGRPRAPMATRATEPRQARPS